METRTTAKEKTYLYGIPEKKSALLELIVNNAIELARKNLGVKFAVNVRMHMIPKSQANKYESIGRTSKKGIEIWVSEKYLNSRELYDNLYGTVIHEYTHFVRLSLGIHDAKKVIGITTEEGLAIFMQSQMTKPPKYLDIKTLNNKMLRELWGKFSDVYYKPSKKYPIIEKNEVYRTINYRLGYGIIREYYKLNRNVTLRSLVRIRTEKITKFVEKMFICLL